MHHYEGGWPKEIDSDDLEAKARFRKKNRTGAVPEGLKTILPSIKETIKQNHTISIYEELFSDEYESHCSEPPNAKILTKFKDPNELKREVKQINFAGEGSNKLVVAYANTIFQV